MPIHELPQSHKEIAELRWTIDARLSMDFQKTLASDERESIKGNIEGFIPQALCSKWDNYIQEAAQQYGARLLLSNIVMARVWAWACGEKNGTHKLGTFFHLIVNSARIAQGEAKGTITDRHRRAKKLYVSQLAELQKRVREEWPDSPAGVRQLVTDAIDSLPQLMILKSNRYSLMQLLANDETALAFRGSPERSRDDLTPTQFFVKWVASSERRSLESVRQDLLPTRAR